MGNSSQDDARARAEYNFKKKELQAQEAEKVWAERADAQKAWDANTARLKDLRLAKNAAEAQTLTPKKSAPDAIADFKAGQTRRSAVAEMTVKHTKARPPRKRGSS